MRTMHVLACLLTNVRFGGKAMVTYLTGSLNTRRLSESSGPHQLLAYGFGQGLAGGLTAISTHLQPGISNAIFILATYLL
jgi:hypothetical protein